MFVYVVASSHIPDSYVSRCKCVRLVTGRIVVDPSILLQGEERDNNKVNDFDRAGAKCQDSRRHLLGGMIEARPLESRDCLFPVFLK